MASIKETAAKKLRDIILPNLFKEDHDPPSVAFTQLGSCKIHTDFYPYLTILMSGFIFIFSFLSLLVRLQIIPGMPFQN